MVLHALTALARIYLAAVEDTIHALVRICILSLTCSLLGQEEYEFDLM